MSKGLLSGQYGGRNRNHAPMSFRIAAAVYGGVFQYHDVAFAQGRVRLGFDMEVEDLAFDWPVHDPRRVQSVVGRAVMMVRICH